jgi:hypothetical protein
MRFCIRSAAAIAGLFIVLSGSAAKAGWYGFTGGAYTIGGIGQTGYLTYNGTSYLWFAHSYCPGTNNRDGTCSTALAGYDWAIPVTSPAYPVFSAAVFGQMANAKSAVQVGCNTCTSISTTPVGMTGTWTFWIPEGITLSITAR